MSMDLIKLLDAPEGSRELDCYLADDLGWHSNPHPDSVKYRGGDFDTIHWSPPDSWGGGPWSTKLPHYTTSLDAKLPWENIENVRRWEVALGINSPSDPTHEIIWDAVHVDPETGMATKGSGHTEPLARRIAALKARGHD